jgi:ribosome-associated protein
MEEDDFISKTQRKRQMTELQAMGKELVALSGEQLARLELPEALLEAVVECQRFTRHEAIRRQLQFIGRVMRNLDAAPIREQLAALKAPSRRQTAAFHVAERWRDELLADPEAVQRFVLDFPLADPLRLRELAGKAREAKGDARSTRAFRELFHAVNAIVQDHARRKT